MPAYCLFDNLEVLDPVALEAYKTAVAPIVERHGGRYVVLGGPAEGLEGDFPLTFPILIEFSDLAAAKAWYGSEEYAPYKALRLKATRSTGVMLTGLNG